MGPLSSIWVVSTSTCCAVDLIPDCVGPNYGAVEVDLDRVDFSMQCCQPQICSCRVQRGVLLTSNLVMSTSACGAVDLKFCSCRPQIVVLLTSIPAVLTLTCGNVELDSILVTQLFMACNADLGVHFHVMHILTLPALKLVLYKKGCIFELKDSIPLPALL